MEYQDLLLEKKDHVAIVTLNQPAKLNALTLGMRASIGKISQDLAKDDDVRVVVLTGAGKGFCPGADVSVQQQRLAGILPPETRFEKEQNIGYPYAFSFPRLNKPVIAAINGACAGAGFSLALSCDIRIAADNVKFVAAQVARGLVPDAAMTFYLPHTIGMSAAFNMIFTAEVNTAAQALELGIVSKVVPLDNLMPAVMELAEKIAAQPPIAVEFAKRAVWCHFLDSIDRALDVETMAQRVCFASEDHKNSVDAFMNKKPTPIYQGK